MDYLKQAKEAVKAGKAEDLLSKIFKFDKPGDAIAGEVVAVDDFTGSEFAETCKRYTLENDNGRHSMILGAAADRQLAGMELVGRVLYIEYLGKQEAKQGKRFNSYRILDVSKSVFEAKA